MRIGRHAATRSALLPWVNFFRSLSPIAWIPFAIIWFGVGDPPAIFIDLNDLVDRRFIPADIQPAMIDATR